MSVPPTPEPPDETPPASGAPTSNDSIIADLPTQPALPSVTPRTTGTPPTEAPPSHAQTFPPQPATPPAPAYSPATPAQGNTSPPAPAPSQTQPPTPTPAQYPSPAARQQMQTQPPSPAQAYTQPPAPAQSKTYTTLAPSSQHAVLPDFASLPVRHTGQRRWIAIAVVAVLLLAALSVGGFGLYATHEAQQPALAAQTFCRDLQTKQYDAAYHMLSSTYQAKTSQARFVEEAGLHDQVDGAAAACAIVRSNAPTGFTLQLVDGATLGMRITRHKPLDGDITVLKEGTSWKVDSIATSLQGTELAPLFVGMTFCKALVAKDYAAVYNTFSSHERSGGSESVFAATFTKAFGANLDITGCTPTVASYAVASNASSATVDVVMAYTGTLARNIEVEDTGVAALKWRNGAMGSVNVTMLT
ncbi:MAG: hypothetical protein ACXWP0_16340, partial [Ktedonobacterales bacterium]